MKEKRKKRILLASRILFAVYLLLLIDLLFLSESFGRAPSGDRTYRYNLVLFREIRRFWVYRHKLGFWPSLVNLGGNILAFLPYGFFLPVLSRRMRRGGACILSGACFSLAVETIQLLARVGSFDVDDILLNTVGAALGYVIFCVMNALRRRMDEKKI